MENNSLFAQPATTAFANETGKPTANRNENPFASGTAGAAGAEDVVAVPDAESRDAEILIEVDGARMTAHALVRPPLGTGKAPSPEMLDAATKNAGLVHGLNPEALALLLLPTYEERLVIARGTSPVNGVNGDCEELFDREVAPKLQEREDGTVDHRQLGLIRDLKPGTAICKLIPPTEGTPGTTVLGEAISPIPGKPATPRVGEGTALSEDGSRIEAAVQGNLVYRNGHFNIDTVYRVQDVDYDVGNIIFSGDVQVNGQMQNGFEIHAGGNVTIQGHVGNVVVVAGGNISIETGINGEGRARLEAGKVLSTGFVENCTIVAGERVEVSSIINSTVECEGNIEATKSHGLICGGKLTTLGSIKAKVVGNESNTLTVFALGVTPTMLAERKKLNEQLADVERHIEEMVKNTRYIEQKMASGKPISDDRIQMLKRSRIQLPMSEKKREQLQRRIAELEATLEDANASTLTAGVMYPPTRVSIGKYSASLQETSHHCKVYKDGASVVFGKG